MMTMNKLKIISHYTEFETLDEVLENKRDRELLWLEILFNDSIEWKRLDSDIIKKS